MPIYIGDYLADTMRLTTEQHGAYILLLFALWRMGTLPDNDKELALITRMPLDEWGRHREALARNFCIADGQWTSSMVDRERVRIAKIQETNTERASLAAKRRWEGKARTGDALNTPQGNSPSFVPMDGPVDAPSIAQALLEETKSQSQSQSQSKSQTQAESQPPSPAKTEPKAKTKAKAKAKTSPDGAGTHDPRHSLFRRMLGEYWQAKNPAVPVMPWSARDGKALSDLLCAMPMLDDTQFATMLRHRARSAVAHGDRVYLWICNVTRYQEEISGYHRPVSAGTNYASRAEINRDSVAHAVSRVLELVESSSDGFGETGDEPADTADAGMPAADGPGPERPALALVGSSHHRVAQGHFAHGETGTNGPVPHYASTAGAGRTVCDGTPGGDSG